MVQKKKERAINVNLGRRGGKKLCPLHIFLLRFVFVTWGGGRVDVWDDKEDLPAEHRGLNVQVGRSLFLLVAKFVNIRCLFFHTRSD